MPARAPLPDSASAPVSLFSELSPTQGDAQFLTALGADADCRTLRPVATFFGKIARDHAPSLTVGHTPKWLDVATNCQAAVKAIFTDESRGEARGLLGAALSHDAFKAPFGDLLFIARFQSNSEHQAMLDRMALVLVLKAAHCGTVTPRTVANGLRQCYRSLTAKKATAWSAIARGAPIDIAQIDDLLSDTTQISTRQFLLDCRTLLAIEFGAPGTEPPSRHERSASQPPETKAPSSSDNPVSRQSTPASDGSSSSEDEADADVSAPSIVSMAREAQYAPLSAKAGVELQWNSITTPELRKLVEEVTPYLDSSDGRLVSCAVLFQVSLLTKANGKRARKTATRLNPSSPDLAISIDEGGLLTSHDAKVQARRPDHLPSHHRINFVYWPRRLMAILRAWKAKWGEQPEIGSYVDLNAGDGGLSNSDYNKFLRDCGDKAHVAEPTRIANGLGLAVFEVTGSDMYASLGALHLEMAAPSADFYFSPLACEVHRQMDRVYQSIGLGPAVPFPAEAQALRLGPQKWVEQEATRDGWSKLEADIRSLYKRVRRWKSARDGGAAFDALSRICCAGLVIHDGGRGTNPQRLSIASLASNRSWYVVDDKFLEGIKRGRLLPHTDVSSSIVQIFLHAKTIAYRRMGWKDDGALDPIFGMTADGRPFGLRSDWVQIDADALQAVTTKYFSADRNFARNQFVTSMGEALVDRWLIRALTGHGTWLLTSFAATMNVPPEEAMRCLRVILMEHAHRMFGDSKALVTLAKSLPPLDLPKYPLDIPGDPAGEATGDPLPSLGRQCLIDHSLVAVVRNQIAQGAGPICSHATALLARLAVDGLPSLEAAIDATLDDESVKTVAATEGVAWRRPYYVHEFWLPSQLQTLATARLAAQSSAPSHKKLLREAADFLRGLPGFCGWPDGDLAVVARFAKACEHWRRLELPPSVCAMASHKVESACLSPTSLERVATNGAFPPKVKFKSILGPFATPVRPARLVCHDLSEITKLLSEWCDTDDSLGGQERRARAIKRGLSKLEGPNRTSVFLFCIHVLKLQADEVIANPRNAHVSTIKTRWSAIHPVMAALPLPADPVDFEDEEWVRVVNNVNEHCLQATQKDSDSVGSYVIGEGKLRSDRARDALQRMFRLLERDAWEIPQAAWDEMGGATFFRPRLSASSSIFLPEYAPAITNEIYANLSPALLAERSDVKVRFMSEAPSRIGEASCVAIRCVTASGAAAFCNTPYAVHKSKHAPRLAPLTAATATAVRKLEDRTRSISPNAQRLYRFDELAQAQDVAANSLLPDLLRQAIGDPEFRPHSLRATAYMELLWPGFRSVLQRLLSDTLSPQECIDWLSERPMSERWIRAISAATAAGHGAVDPGYKFYASAWPLILAIWMKAKSRDLQPAEASFKAFGRTAANFRQVKCRSKDSTIDAWRWMPAAMVRRKHRPLLEHAIAVSEDPPPSAPRFPRATRNQQIRYAVLRCLKMTPDVATQETGLPDALQSLVERGLPNSRDIEWARKRKKGQDTLKALEGDRSLALDASGVGIIDWIVSLAPADTHDLFAILRRNPSDLSFPIDELQAITFWRRISAALAPGFCLTLRFGEGKHLSPSSELRLKELKPLVVVTDERDRDLGPIPDVMLRHVPANDRLDCRSTAIFKLACLIRQKVTDSYATTEPNNEPHSVAESNQSAAVSPIVESSNA